MMPHAPLLITLASILGCLLVFSLGANEIASIFSAALGANAMTVRYVILIALGFECAGAIFGNGLVSSTMRYGIVDMNTVHAHAQLLTISLFAILLSGLTWMFITTFLGLPVSIMQTVISAIVGCSMLSFGTYAVHWGVVAKLAISWVVTPIMAGVIASLLVHGVLRTMLNIPHPFTLVKRNAPLLLFGFGFIFTFIAIIHGLNHWHYILTARQQFMLSFSFGAVLLFFGKRLINRVAFDVQLGRQVEYQQVEKIFSILVVFATSAMLFAHGANDLGDALGPYALLLDRFVKDGHVLATGVLPWWMISGACIVMVLGLLMMGHRVIATVGQQITLLTPSRAFIATFAAAITSILAGSMGLEVSATQIFVGAILGVGLSRGTAAVQFKTVRHIVLAWVLTFPLVATLAMFYFVCMQVVLT
ncbi:MAG: phosphate transporter [marine bacterium B5-7]|nr:MAG: phosphate transporter [marine bacterium B5-7]